MQLDVCKGAGMARSEITHEVAAVAGLPRNTAYRIQVRGIRAETDFRAHGTDIIRYTSARDTGSGELPAWERPDVLLGVEAAKRLEGYLRAGWCKDRETQRGSPTQKAKPNQPEAGERRSKREEKEKWTYVQRIRTGAEGADTELKVMFDSHTPHTLILHAAAAKAALAPAGRARWVMSPDIGELDESSCGYSVPLVDWQGNVHLLKARGVDYTIYAKERKVPPTAAAVFTEMEGKALKAHQAAGMVDLIIGQDNSKWHPIKVCDSWQAENNLTLMRSRFPPRYIVRETTWTKHSV
jgi:hypothetical protein